MLITAFTANLENKEIAKLLLDLYEKYPEYVFYKWGNKQTAEEIPGQFYQEVGQFVSLAYLRRVTYDIVRWALTLQGFIHISQTEPSRLWWNLFTFVLMGSLQEPIISGT